MNASRQLLLFLLATSLNAVCFGQPPERRPSEFSSAGALQRLCDDVDLKFATYRDDQEPIIFAKGFREMAIVLEQSRRLGEMAHSLDLCIESIHMVYLHSRERAGTPLVHSRQPNQDDGSGLPRSFLEEINYRIQTLMPAAREERLVAFKSHVEKQLTNRLLFRQVSGCEAEADVLVDKVVKLAGEGSGEAISTLHSTIPARQYLSCLSQTLKKN